MPEPGFLRAVEVLTDALLTPQEFARHKPAANQMEMKWITVHPHGEGEEGRRIQINTKTGEIEKGFGAGKTMHEAFSPKSETPAASETPKPAEEFKSPFHGDEESRHWYGANNRPIGHATVPRGFIETKNHDAFRHGAVAYPQPLSEKDQYDYELTPIHGDEAIPELAKKLGGEMDKYASQYADPENDSILDDFLGQEKSRKLLGHVDKEKLKAEFRKQFGQHEEETSPEPQKPEDAILSKYPSLAEPPKQAEMSEMVRAAAGYQLHGMRNEPDDRAAWREHSQHMTKSAIDGWLMKKFGIDSATARAVSNAAGEMNPFTTEGAGTVGGQGVKWNHNTPEPTMEELGDMPWMKKGEAAKDDRLTPQGAIRGLKSKITDTESRIPKLEAAITKESGKEYKSNSGRIAKKDQFGEYVGEQSIGDVNEKRRANKVESLKRQLAEAKSDLGSYRNQLENLVRQHGDPDAPPPGEVDKDGYPVFSKEEDDDLRNFLLGGGDEKPQAPSLPPEIAAKYPSLAETPKEPESAKDRANRMIFEQSINAVFNNYGDTGFVQGDASTAKRIADKFGAKLFDAGAEFQKQLREASDAAGAKWDAVQRAMISEDPELRRKAGVLCNRAWKKVADQINGDTGKLVIHGMDDVVNQPGLADATGSILGAGFRGNNRPDESAIIVSGKGVGVPPGRRQIVEHDQEKSAAWDSLQESIEKQRMEKEAAEAPKRELERQKKEADESARQAKEKDEADRSEAARLKVHSELMDTVDKMKPGKDFVPPKTITKKFRKELETSIALASDNRNPEMLKEAADRWIAKFATPKSPEAAIAEKYPSLADAPEKSGQVSPSPESGDQTSWDDMKFREAAKAHSDAVYKYDKLSRVAAGLSAGSMKLADAINQVRVFDGTESVKTKSAILKEAQKAKDDLSRSTDLMASANQWAKSISKPQPNKPFKPEGIPGEQMGLFDQDAGGQKSLFNVVKPDKKSKKAPAAAPSELEKIRDEHKARSEESAPLPGQKSIRGLATKPKNTAEADEKIASQKMASDFLQESRDEKEQAKRKERVSQWRSGFTGSPKENNASGDIARHDWEKALQNGVSPKRLSEMVDSAVQAGALDAGVGKHLKSRFSIEDQYPSLKGFVPPTS